VRPRSLSQPQREGIVVSAQYTACQCVKLADFRRVHGRTVTGGRYSVQGLPQYSHGEVLMVVRVIQGSA
jgi:hypothetical protein